MGRDEGNEYPKCHVVGSVGVHSGLRFDGILAREHLDERMSLILVDYARLDGSICFKQLPQVIFSNAASTVSETGL